MPRATRIFLAFSLLAGAAYFVLPHSSTSKLVLYNGVGLASVLMMLYGIRRNKPEPRGPWLFFAAGQASFLTADVIYYVTELVTDGNPPFPSLADAFYLLMYPLVILGLSLLVRSVTTQRNATSVIDAAIVATAMFGATWVLFVDSVLVDNSMSTAGRITTMAYPIMDVAMLAVAARLVVAVHLKHPPFAFLSLAIISLAFADTMYGIYNVNGIFHTGLFIDAFWLGFYVLFALAALHPSVRSTARTYLDSSGRITGRQLVIMGSATLGMPAIDLIWGNEEDRIVTTVSSALLFFLVLARVFGLMRALQHGQERLRHDAVHDHLTGLANRVLFSQRTAAALDRDGRNRVAVLFVDLDDFKTVNDSLGHQAGDALLKEIARRLSLCVRDGDTVARLGGDEFAILLESAVDQQDAVSVAQRALDALSVPIELGDRTIQSSASIGIAMDLDGERNVDDLLRNADVAMYLSKTRGKGRFEFFERRMHNDAVERLDLRADLQQALDQRQFVLKYQPIFDLDSGRPVLVEALLRWNHPEKGLISPDRFITLAEDTGLIVPIGEWVLSEACRQARQWQRLGLGLDELGVTVNLSMRQLHDTRLLGSVTEALRASGLEAKHLVLEITESMLALDAARSARALEQLKTIGVSIAIDDFGTGYSSLSYLRTFPVDSIKIDRSFVHELHRSPTSTALVEAVVNLSKALGAYTVAEGIEHDDQADILARLGCDRAQGFFYCRPMNAAALTAMFKEHACPTEGLSASWRHSAGAIADRMHEVETLHGIAEIELVSPELAQLTRATGQPVMAGWPWLEAWATAFNEWEPLMVGIRTIDRGELAAAAFLARRPREEGTAIVAMGHGSSLYTAMPAMDDGAAVALADAIAKMLGDLSGPWSLEIEQLVDFDPVAVALAQRLDHAQILPELRVPRVLFAQRQTVDTLFSKNMRKQLRRSRAKVADDGLNMTIGFDRGAAVTPDLLDEVETIHVARDHDARRRSDLDRPAERTFWRTVAGAQGDHWDVEIATLRLDGELAAYVVALLDGDTYRVYDGRMNTKFADYSPGRLVEAAALTRAMGDSRFRAVDWMSGVAAEKLLVANGAENRTRLVATSGSGFAFPARRMGRTSVGV